MGVESKLVLVEWVARRDFRVKQRDAIRSKKNLTEGISDRREGN